MNKAPLLTANLRWFLFAMVLANIASEMVFTLLPVYLSELGASVAQIGLVFSVASLVPLMLQIMGGWLSDSIGRLRTIAIGSLGGSLGYLGLLLAPSWPWAMLALCLEYISGSMVGPSFGAFIAEQSTEENRGRTFGVMKGIFLMVTVLGPLLGGFLAGRYGFKLMLLVALALYTSATVLRVWMATAIRFVGKVTPEPLTLASFRTKIASMMALLTAGGVITWILITDGVQDVASRLSGELQPLYLSQIGGMSVEQVGWLKSTLGIAMMSVTLPAGWLSDKRGERVAIVIGFFLQFVALMIFVQSSGFASFAMAAVVFGLGLGMLIPAYDSLVSKAVPENLRGTAFGLFQTSLGVVSLPAPWIGAQLWERLGARVPFVVTAIAALISTVPAWSKFVLPEKERNRLAPEPGSGANSDLER